MLVKVDPKNIFQSFMKDFETERFLAKRTIPSMTKILKNYFYELGKSKGFEPWTTKRGKEVSYEYLVDHCWAVKDQKGIWLEMALESELSERNVEGILYDFEKLTDVKAFLKIGIFHPQIKRIEEVASKCAELIRRHRIKIVGEQYLLIFLTERQRNRRWYLKVSGYLFDHMGKIKMKMLEKEFDW